MERIEIERPSSGEGYVHPLWARQLMTPFKPCLVCLGNNDVTSPGPNKQDSPSAPVQPLKVGFGGLVEKA